MLNVEETAEAVANSVFAAEASVCVPFALLVSGQQYQP